ncbi:MAG: hypothetical protein H7Y20_02325 [Bryobacteraceae bacterium]|nr:hypothetical protein [Bryobacteraceae bacterium]
MIRTLTAAGIRTFATLAPILPCDPEELAAEALESTREDLIGDPLHIRSVKPTGASTREAARQIALRYHHDEWFEPAFQSEVTERIRRVAASRGRRFSTGPEGFSWLSRISKSEIPYSPD